MEYVLGVDGDNNYTRYFLFSLSGKLTDYLMDSTSSREIVGFEGATGVLRARIQQLLFRNHLKLDQIVAAGFGLAGVDSEKQRLQFEEFLTQIGMKNVRVTNDTFLGVICGTTDGSGVCSLHSIGCATGGINENGHWHQVGGLGRITGDDGGSGYLAETALRAVYSACFRNGEQTLMSLPILAQLGIERPEEMQDALIEARVPDSLELVRIVFAAAEMDDPVALDILRHVAHELACNAAGCIQYLGFEAAVEVVLAGGIWRKAENELLLRMFRKELQAMVPQPVKTILLDIPIAVGAVMLAYLQLGINPYEKARKAEISRGVTSAIKGDYNEWIDR